MSDRSSRAGALLGAERHRRLYQRLVDRGSIRVTEEARLFEVSDETIRRDIKALVGAGLAEAVFGGAVLPAEAGPIRLPPVDERQTEDEDAKNAIGAAAAARVEAGQIVILDAGTTTLALARHLRGRENLTIVTNSLVIAQTTGRFPTCTTYVIGGKLVTGSMSLVGPQAQRDLARIAADWAFLGAAAMSARSGFLSADPYEAEVKQAMMRAAKTVAVVADASKFEKRGLVSFAKPESAHVLFTSAGAPEDGLAALRAAGVEIAVCPPSPEERHV
ncbi:MAG TPA: DeoR/GlpR family DNA-binding transcription regulator [Beijerinckiaceae bacterium]|nr:DeoR/GlpR family DNA-binding transcription regulator [Beijerinckiaceae bacterium]